LIELKLFKSLFKSLIWFKYFQLGNRAALELYIS